MKTLFDAPVDREAESGLRFKIFRKDKNTQNS